MKSHPKLLEFQQIMWAMTVFKDLQNKDVYEIIAASNILNRYLGQQRQIRLEHLLGKMNPIPVEEK